MSTISENIEITIPFIGTLLITSELLKKNKAVLKKLSGETCELFFLGSTSFQRLKNMPISCLKKLIKIDYLNKRAFFEEGLKGGSANIVWIDANIFNHENSRYFKKKIPGHLFIKRFDNISDPVSYINSYKREKLLVIASGSLGKEIVSKIKYEYVLAVIIFCNNIMHHKKWAVEYNIIKHVLNSFEDVIRIIQEQYLSIKQDLNHIQFSANAYKSFYDLISTTKNSNMLGKVAITDELFHLAIDHKDEIKQILNERPIFGEALIFLYTTNIIYREFNNAFKKDELHKVILTSSLCLKDMMTIEANYFDGEYLYRGIKSSDISVYKASLETSTPIFIPGFVSASQLKSVARGFSGENGIIFKIKLNKKGLIHI